MTQFIIVFLVGLLIGCVLTLALLALAGGNKGKED